VDVFHARQHAAHGAARRLPYSEAEAAMKILLWKIGALGDIVMTTPLVRQLRRALPGACIDYLTGSNCTGAIQGNPHLDHVRGFDPRILYAPQPARLGEVLRQLRGYDCVFCLDKHWVFGLLARLAGVPRRIGFERRRHEGLLLTDKVRYGAVRHELDYYLDLADAAGWRADRGDRILEAPPETSSYPVPAGCTVLINSGGANANESSQVRRMPDALFEGLVATCAAEAPVVFLGAPDEAAYYARFASGRCDNLCGRTSLAEAVSVLRQAGRVITTDTGLMHLAAAVNPRVTAVFGPTHPMRKCPPGARWVWGDEARYDAAYELFGTVPDGRYFQSLTIDEIVGFGRPSRGPHNAASP
jgi:ADP-heptose:LPS heptosyltransferase